MNYLFIRSPEAMAIRGGIAIVLGIVVLLLPGPTFLALAIAFGTFAMIDGILALISLFDRTSKIHRGWMALEAVAGICTGILTVVWPAITAVALTYLIAAWAIATGVMKIAAAIRLRTWIRHEWMLGLSGVLSIAFGTLIALTPTAGILGLMWAIGIFGLLFGAMLISLSARLRRAEQATLAEEETRPRAA